MASPSDFAQYVNSVLSLEELGRMTYDMEKEIEYSKIGMDLFGPIPVQSPFFSGPVGRGLRHEDISNFLEAGVPKLLLPDMAEAAVDVDLDYIVTSMKGYAEGLKNTVVSPKTPTTNKDMGSLEMDQYASSLDQLGKRLANIKLSKREEVTCRNPTLEAKLTQLCQDVNALTQLVQIMSKVTECDKNWSQLQQDNRAYLYNDMLTNLLSQINEVLYLMRNQN